VRQAGNATLEALLPVVYNDVHERLYPVAGRSLLAHLIKLEAEGKVEQTQAQWRMA